MTDDTDITVSDSRRSELATRYGRLVVPDIENDLIGRFLSRYGEWAWLEAVFVASVIPDGARVLDAGAFVGTFGLGIARLRRLELLCCVEANSVILSLLDHNVQANARCPFVVLEALVAGSEASAAVGHSQPGNLGSMSFSAGPDPDASGAIRAMTLASLRAEYGAFDLIKLDIEGMELDVLRSDVDFLAQGKTTLWIEANEDVRSLEIADLLLSANLELFYFAFPAFNPKNFNGDAEPVFAFAFEAGLLAAPATRPSLSPELIEAGCILRPVRCLDDLKDALWRTPRWGMAEWQGAATTAELAALVGRSILGESFADFLTSGSEVTPGAKRTIWQRLEDEQAALRDARASLSLVEDALRQAQALAVERLRQLDAEHRLREQTDAGLRTATGLAVERLHQLEAERQLREQVEAHLIVSTGLAAQRLHQLEAERLRSEQIIEALHTTTAQWQCLRNDLDAIQSSTAWRISSPLRRLGSRHPGLRSAVRALRTSVGGVLRRLRRPGANAVMAMPAQPTPAAPALLVDPHHREAVRPYFDAVYYLAVNQDIAAAGIDPLDHFVQQGWREGRAPGPGFDVTYYLEANPDVATAGVNPVVHYAWTGKAEGRSPQRAMDVTRLYLRAAASPRERAADWISAVDRSTPLSPDTLAAALWSPRGRAGTVISVSHDDYGVNIGGIQNLIADEQFAFAAAEWRYLHLSPAAPLPMLADLGPAETYRLRLRLDGEAIGVAAFPDLAAVLSQLRGGGNRQTFIFHHLLGHMPEWLATLPQAGEADTIVWVHDFFTLCSGFTLLRNDVKFCGAPRARSAACTICVYGEERQEHLARIHDFFEAIHPTVLAPSAVALDLWRSRSGCSHAGTAVVPPARLIMDVDGEPLTTPDEAPLRIAHLGGVSVHKGWPTFEQLATTHIDDPRYEFYHLGVGGSPSSRYIQDPIRVTTDQRDAMIEAVIRHRIDVVVNWAIWPETFSFVTHEALAGGAFVIARQAAGNVWPAVDANAPDQGCAVADEAELFQLFESGDIRTRVARARRFRGHLQPSGSTADYLLVGRTATRSLAPVGALPL